VSSLDLRFGWAPCLVWWDSGTGRRASWAARRPADVRDFLGPLDAAAAMDRLCLVPGDADVRTCQMGRV